MWSFQFHLQHFDFCKAHSKTILSEFILQSVPVIRPPITNVQIFVGNQNGWLLYTGWTVLLREAFRSFVVVI